MLSKNIFLGFNVEVVKFRTLQHPLSNSLNTIRNKMDVIEMEQLLATLYDYVQIIELSADAEIIYVSEAFADLFKLNAKDLLGKNITEYESKNQYTFTSIQSVSEILTGETNIADFVFDLNATTIYKQALVVPIFDTNNQLMKIILFFLDHQNDVNDSKDLDYLNSTLISKAVELEMLNKKLQHNKKMLEIYNIELMALAKNDAVQGGDWDRAIDILLIKVATILNVSRVSFWNYNTYSESIVCMAQFTDGEINRNSIELTKKEFPNYFEAIEKERMIQAVDAFENVYTKDFAESYLKPLNIQSMLDVPYYLDEELGGVLCIEQQINSKNWTTEDVLFARGISDILTIAWKSFQRNTAEKKLFETNKHIEKINQELKQQQEYIYTLNQELEAKVETRTLLLKRQNEKLSEYAFINAHLLRGPLCRIKGLVQVMELNLDNKNEMENLLKYLVLATDELDNVVKKITNHLEEGRYFDRNDIREIEVVKKKA